ncbi:DUF4860 domain-containing protein [Paludicola sp. MB14-C6]|uniref:DUF4860 domain-containing protein n=1 Tax=Paludihabitans sp. MB14-C6 TaxID=3070656 RepID=UPI0027DD9B66|nr:DUF4860 domain-containing protein [Paludicola sp. MB14-C6]WMJ22323.1 DUF4860 domain-containing protein [Paludicola sp. MB14-C6]
MKTKETTTAITSLLVLLVFGMFAIGSLFVVLIGASDYKSIVDRAEQNNQIRASLSYVANKIKQGDESASIQVVNQDNLQLLTITQNIDGQLYDTYIYYHKGVINEQFIKHNAKLNPNAGTPIVEADDFRVSKENSTITLQVKCSKITQPLQLKVRLNT